LVGVTVFVGVTVLVGVNVGVILGVKVLVGVGVTVGVGVVVGLGTFSVYKYVLNRKLTLSCNFLFSLDIGVILFHAVVFSEGNSISTSSSSSPYFRITSSISMRTTQPSLVVW
jgi:hypothetical protein